MIQTPDVNLLIDAGKNARALTRALAQVGIAPECINAVFITHEHRDHTAALPVFLKQNPIPVHITAASRRALRIDLCEEQCGLFVVHPPLYTETFGSTTITSFPLSHDSRACVGYRIVTKTERGAFTIGFATDMGVADETVYRNLLGCDAVVMECNHDTEMLFEGPYPFDLKERIASRYGHLCNRDAAELAAALQESGTRAIMLAHLSENNNLPDLAFGEVRAALGDNGTVLAVACPDCPVELTLPSFSEV